MKKAWALLVLLMFLVSAVPLAIADNNNDDTENSNTLQNRNKAVVAKQVRENAPEDATPRQIATKINKRLAKLQSTKAQNILKSLPSKAAVLQKLDRARLQDCLEDVDECKERLENMVVKKVKVKNLLRVREIAANKIQAANQAFQKAKEQYNKAKQFQEQAMNEFLGLRAQLQLCQDSGEDCLELEGELLEKAKDNLIGIADRLIQHLEKIKSKVESDENMDSDEAQEAIDKLNDLILELEDAKDDVEAATNKEELDEAAQEIRDIWSQIQYTGFRYAERVIWGQVKGIFVRSEMLEKKLETVLDRLESKGVDTSELEDLLDQFSDYIEDARSKMGDADDKFGEAKELRAQGDKDGAKQALEEAKSLTREAHQALKNAHRVLMQIVRSINQNGESFDPDEIDEDEDVDVVEEVECTVDADCEEGFVCVDNECEEEEEEVECTEDADCEEGFVCVDSGCEEEEEEAECIVDADCENGRVCVDGECQEEPEETGCTEDADCEEGYICVDNECEEESGETQCADDTDCEEGQVCVEGECEDEEGE